MNIEEMRAIISDAYPGRSWKARCNIMRPQQVIAIYHSIMKYRNAKPEVKTNRGKRQSDPGYQFTIFDFMKGE